MLGLYAAGISDDLLTNVLLATRAPVLVAPAMHTEMWEHAAVQDNLTTLRRRGVLVVEPEVGRLAGGDVGAGRLAEPERIVAAAEAALAPQDLAGLKVLVTAGGTREPIDPVRYVSNRSSGKQGHALADEAAARGAQVTLVTTVGRPVAAGVEVVAVETAAEMADAVLGRSDGMRRGRDGGRRRRLPAGRRRRPQAQEGRRRARARTRADRRHPRRPRCPQAARAGRRRVRRRDRRRRRQRHRQARTQGRRPRRGQRRVAPEHGFEHDTNEVVIVGRGGLDHHVPLADKRAIARAVLDAVVEVRTNQEPLVTDRYTFTSESVTEGHPDKMADQISDAVLDAILAEDPVARVACETMVTTGLAIVAGEITTEAYVEIPKIVRETIKGIGYDREAYGYDGNTCGVMTSIDPQSPDIAQGVDTAFETRSGPRARTSSTARAPATRG